MNQYGLWTPRGTSNSEYGKFVFQNNFGPVRENFQKGNGEQWEDGNYYHHQGQGDVGHQPQYTVHFGEEAAAAALGGKDKLQAHLANAFQTQQQTVTGDQQPAASDFVPEPEVVQEQPEVCNVPVVEQAAEPEKIPTEKPASVPKPVKWRGLPPAIKYERQMRPLRSQMKALSVLPPTNMNFSTMGNKGSRIPPNFFQQQESQESQMISKSKPTTAFSPKKKFVSPPKPELCGRCPKCKSIVPESNGPLVMTFPNNSAGLAKPNVRRMHSRGRQDAKNFRAVQHPHH